MNDSWPEYNVRSSHTVSFVLAVLGLLLMGLLAAGWLSLIVNGLLGEPVFTTGVWRWIHTGVTLGILSWFGLLAGLIIGRIQRRAAVWFWIVAISTGLWIVGIFWFGLWVDASVT